jgi:hypothetical protein
VVYLCNVCFHILYCYLFGDENIQGIDNAVGICEIDAGERVENKFSNKNEGESKVRVGLGD